MNLKSVLSVCGLLCAVSLRAQTGDDDYIALRNEIVKSYGKELSGKFGFAPPLRLAEISTGRKWVALTFDACGGPTGSGVDDDLILWLQTEGIPATLFMAGSWIDAHPDLVEEFSRDTLFEIENHGLNHCPCSVNGRSRYGIAGTENVSEVVDEIELNARKIFAITHRRPVFYRAATATSDEACARIANALGEQLVGFTVLSGDAVAGTSMEEIRDNIVSKAENGAIVILHMNRPERNSYEALRQAVPALRKMGYSFIRLQQGLPAKSH